MTDPNGDRRPRPQFGEYATPEQQRAHIREPASEPPAPPTPGAPPFSRMPPPAVPPSPSGRAQQVAQPHAADRLVSLMLLGFGAVNVVLSIPQFLNLSALATQTMALQGIPGTFTNTSAAQVWGVVATVVLIAGYLCTLTLSLRRLRRGKIAWWVPLAGAAVTYAVVFVCVVVPLFGDPAISAYLLQNRGG
ncbi:hypothetical protein LK09_05525 [Microbacterium mangrovi]|uniref:Uncharacterized protein n=1 Tax=Microbacterium mangrovi TaxID=1348253 RepID=A0A0B2A9Y7_9MICO|nr:DUF6264 family protein [Microbacterium mangrovi]KHK98456.1 hypothetical protein LK09_05525 [Microbacterium mangrovi]